MDKIKVLIADDVEDTREVIKKILTLESETFEVVGEAGNGEEVVKLIPKAKPDVVLMDINMPIMNGLEATEQISDEFPSVIVIIMSVQGESEYLKKAMLHGAKEYIIKPFSYDVLVETIKTTYEKHKERMQKQHFHEEVIRNAKVITYFSSKGGVGKSVLALNSAVALSKESGKKVLLLDMDLQFGDISMMVNKYNEKTILDLIEDGQLTSYENMKSYLYKYNENLDIIFAPGKPEAAEFISKDSIDKLIKIIQKEYDIIIVDTGINFNDNTLLVLDISETILFVSTMEIAALKNTKLGFGVMKSLGYDNKKVKLVLNRFTCSYGINKKDVEEAFKDNILIMLPDDENTVIPSVNKGQPFCDNTKYFKSKIGKGIQDMCKILLKSDE
ncbi:MAG: response regulator [Bacillota bacterium]|nr:response regulator [Bacillota bacterium]